MRRRNWQDDPPSGLLKGHGPSPQVARALFLPPSETTVPARRANRGVPLLGGAGGGVSPFEPPPAPCFDSGGTPPPWCPPMRRERRRSILSPGGFPVSLEIFPKGSASVACIDLLQVRIPPHDSCPIPTVGSKTGRGDGPFSPFAPGRRRRGFSNPSPLRRRLVTLALAGLCLGRTT